MPYSVGYGPSFPGGYGGGGGGYPGGGGFPGGGPPGWPGYPPAAYFMQQQASGYGRGGDRPYDRWQCGSGGVGGMKLLFSGLYQP